MTHEHLDPCQESSQHRTGQANLCRSLSRKTFSFFFFSWNMFFFEQTRLSPPTNDSVQGGAAWRASPHVRQQKKREDAPQWRPSTVKNQVSRAFTTVSPRSEAQVGACPPMLLAEAWKAQPGDSNSGCCACSARTRVRSLEPSRWSHRRSPLHWLVTQRVE